MIKALRLSLCALAALGSCASLAYAQTPPAEGSRVARAMLTLRVCDVPNAGTDDAIIIRLNPYNETLLNYPGNDFERGREFTYDLLLNDVYALRDIWYLWMTKWGSNKVCFDKVQLRINDQTVIFEDLQPHWVGEDDGNAHKFYAPLRGTPLWNSYRQHFGTDLAVPSRVAAAAGTVIGVGWTSDYPGSPKSSAVGWDSKIIQVSFYDTYRLQVDLNLRYRLRCRVEAVESQEVWTECANIPFTVSFRLRFDCRTTSTPRSGGYVTGGAAKVIFNPVGVNPPPSRNIDQIADVLNGIAGAIAEIAGPGFGETTLCVHFTRVGETGWQAHYGSWPQ